MLAFLSGEMKKLEEDERQIRIVIAEHEELVRQQEENLHYDNPEGSTDQHNLLALPSVPNYIENCTDIEQQAPEAISEEMEIPQLSKLTLVSPISDIDLRTSSSPEWMV